MSHDWTLGEVFVLRHAGFPFDWLESLGFNTTLEEKVGAVLEAEAALLSRIEEGGGEKAVRAAKDALARKRVIPLKSPWVETCQPWLEAYQRAYASLSEAFGAQRQALRAQLREVARRPEIQEAVFLSSPAMYENVWLRYLQRAPEVDNADTRRVERQVYTYLQRFCAKNETTSFFGPIAYGSFEKTEKGAPPLKLLPSQGARRRTFFAFWAVTELARAVSRDRSLRAHVPVTLNPLFERSPGKASCAPLKLEVALDAEAEALLAALAQVKTLNEAALQLGWPLPLVERRALPLLKSALLLMGIRFTANDFKTFESLREAVQALPEGEGRARWLSELAELERLRSAFEAGALSERRALLPQLEARFLACTGKAARRGEGQVYSDRLILYEEAASPFRVELSQDFGEELNQRLSGALEVSAAFGEKVQRSYGEQVVEALGPQSEPLDFLDYAVRLRPDQVAGSRFSPVPPVRVPEEQEAQSTWRMPEDWLGRPREEGRYALPDVCLAARTTPDGAIHYDVLLSRVHHHLLLWSWLAAFHPDSDRYRSVAQRWLSRASAARGLVGLSLRRRNKGFYVYPGPRLSYAVTDVLDVEEGALTPRDVRVRVGAEGPVLENQRGQALRLYLSLDDFSTYPPFASLAHPLVLHAPLRAQGDHVPRIQIGGALYQRERWELACATYASLSGLPLLLALHREKRKRGWPRFVYARSTTERKPYLIDFHSPFALDLMLHLLRGAERVSFDEMYPPPEALWLKDDRGRYTCEMRMQATRAEPE